MREAIPILGRRANKIIHFIYYRQIKFRVIKAVSQYVRLHTSNLPKKGSITFIYIPKKKIMLT